jgi:hypothetical protein
LAGYARDGLACSHLFLLSPVNNLCPRPARFLPRRLHLDASTDMENRNSAGYLEKCKAVILENLRGLQAAPSVAFQERPPDWSVREVEEELRSLGGSLNPDVRPGQPGSDVAPGGGAGAGGALSAAPSMLSGLGGVEGTREHDAELYDHERDIDRGRGVPTGDDGMIDVEAARAEAAAATAGAGSSSAAAAGGDGVETVAEGASATLAAVGTITGPDGSSSAAAEVYALATGDAAGADSSAAEVAAAADAAAAGAADAAEQALADAMSAGAAGQEHYREGGGEELADL